MAFLYSISILLNRYIITILFIKKLKFKLKYLKVLLVTTFNSIPLLFTPEALSLIYIHLLHLKIIWHTCI